MDVMTTQRVLPTVALIITTRASLRTRSRLWPYQRSAPADVSRNTLKCHNSNGACLLSDASLLNIRDIHYNTSLEHLRKARLDGKRSLLLVSHCECFVYSDCRQTSNWYVRQQRN